MASMCLRRGGRFYLEFRTDENATAEKVYGEHFRKYLPGDTVVAEIEEWGGQVRAPRGGLRAGRLQGRGPTRLQSDGNMETLKARLRDVVARQGRRIGRIAGYEVELRALHDRVAELEREIQESRLLNQRLAELTDVVAEVLVPAADRDDRKLADRLTAYNRESF